MSQPVLAIDTALQGCAVGLFANGRVFARNLETLRGQAEFLVPMVEDILAEASLKPSDLGAVVTTLGPGSFTGLRIGMSAAKSYALALDVPLYGMTTLRAMAMQYAQQAQPAENFTVLLETKRSDFYVQHFDASGAPLSEPLAQEGGDIVPQPLLIGDAVARFCGEDVENFKSLDMGFVAQLFTQAPELFTDVVDPLYLRGADVSMPKTTPRKLKG